MVMQGNGWPLGLGNMNARIREALGTPGHHLLRQSSSFSSISSSDLDTESTASFYPDSSVSLGRLIGMWPACKGRLVCEDKLNVAAAADERSHQLHDRQPPKGQSHNSQGICVPLLHHVFGRSARTPNPSPL